MAPRKSHLYRKLRDQVRARGEHCYRCGQPINYELKWPDPESFTLEHVKPRLLYPELEYDPANCRASHLTCNSSAQAGGTRTAPTVTTRRW